MFGTTRDGAIELADKLSGIKDMAPGGHLKYLLIPACYSCSFEAADNWLPLLTRGNPVHGVLGYAKTYAGDATGANLMRNFGLAVGLARLATTAKVIHFDRSNFASGGSVVQVGTPDFEAMFHQADGTEINRGNNGTQHAPPTGLFQGKAGFVLIKANNGNRFSAGQKIALVFHYFRPQKREMNLDTVLRFALGPPKVQLLRDANTQKEGGPTGFVDGIEYTFGAGEQEARLDFTVLPDAAKSYKSDGASRTHGRFMIHVFRPGTSTADPRAAISMYAHGAYLRE